MLEKFIIEPILAHAEYFAKAVFTSLVPLSQNLLVGLVLLWLTLVAYKVIIYGELLWHQVLTKLLIFMLVGTLLMVNNKIYYEYIHDPIKLATQDLVNNILTIAPQVSGQQLKNSKQAIAQVDAVFSDLISLVTLVSKKASFSAAAFTAIVTFVIWGLFIVSEAIFALYLVGNTLKLAAISALSPLLIVAVAFEKTRAHAIGGLKYVLTSALTLFIAAFCMALILLILRKFVLELKIETLPADQVFSTLSALLILALSSIYFLKLAPEIATAIIGASTNSIVAQVVGGTMAGFMSASKWNNALNSTVPVVTNTMVGANQIRQQLFNNIRTRFANNYATTTGEQQNNEEKYT